MKIVQVIHGYPMRYNAGSEVYTQTLAHALASRHEVHVFTREEDSFSPDYAVRTETDPDDERVRLRLVNMARTRDGYRHVEVDARFAEMLDELHPDVVHIGHLNHLSTSLVEVAAHREIPIVFTLHDYWLMCPRGQFMQTHPASAADIWAACDGQEDGKCAERCYARYFSGATEERSVDVRYWTDWVTRRMRHARAISELVDVFLAPAEYLLRRYRDAFGIPEAKLTFLDYGFDRKRLLGRSRSAVEPFTFGYIGTHIPAKGIHQLLEAFGMLPGASRLRIWGRPRGQDTDSLKRIAAYLPGDAPGRVEWMGEYRNQDIVRDVFNRVDAIVVPSVWVENSPLVIHEAQQARVPVITADEGGMAEYVGHELNGLLFRHRDVSSLAEQMQRLASEPVLAHQLGDRGYLGSASGDVPDIESHAVEIERVYSSVLKRRTTSALRPRPGPWRITFDTNPDDCNLMCMMCERHSLEAAGSSGAVRRTPRRMPFELIERVVSDAACKGLREVIPSTMGEPLLYEHFEALLALCARVGVRLNLTTNGTFPRLGAEAWARRIVPVCSDTKISFNGARAQTQARIMRGSDWAQIIENIRAFLAVRDEHAAQGGNRCSVTLQVTFLESNLQELPDLVRMAAKLGADRVKGHHVWVHHEGLRLESLRRSEDSIARWNATVQACRDAAEELLPTRGHGIRLENFEPLGTEGMHDLAPGAACPFLGREAWINAEGRFDPCCAPDAQRQALGDFGNVRESSLMCIWESDAYRGLLKTWRNRNLCLACNMRRPQEVAS
jgi:glycosyltransferase involved in cell wall biosynthesis/MoaA/NifB/PqqE/SkfB family radical SAM enzyme